MQNLECVVNKVYKSKNGELCVSFKFKYGEVVLSDEEALRAAWREGTPLQLDVQLFQPDPIQPTEQFGQSFETPNQTSL